MVGSTPWACITPIMSSWDVTNYCHTERHHALLKTRNSSTMVACLFNWHNTDCRWTQKTAVLEKTPKSECFKQTPAHYMRYVFWCVYPTGNSKHTENSLLQLSEILLPIFRESDEEQVHNLHGTQLNRNQDGVSSQCFYEKDRDNLTFQSKEHECHQVSLHAVRLHSRPNKKQHEDCL